MLLGIASALESPIKLDDRTMRGDFGQYVRVLVVIDFREEIPESIMVVSVGECMIAFFKLENPILFYTNCRIVGHNLPFCRKDQPPGTAPQKHPRKTNRCNPGKDAKDVTHNSIDERPTSTTPPIMDKEDNSTFQMVSSSLGVNSVSNHSMC